MMMGGPEGMSGMPPMQHNLGQKKGGPKNTLPKLFADVPGKKLPFWKIFINKGYGLFFIVTDFCKKVLWFGSCIGLMYLFPMMIEYMGEQNRILMKLQMQMMNSDMVGGPPSNNIEVRPF